MNAKFNNFSTAALATRSITGLLMVLVFSISAALADADNFIAQPDEPHGLLITNVEQTGRLIFPVELYSVNGQRITFRSQGILLKPGKHTVQARAGVINRDFVPGLRRDISAPNGKAIEIDVEAGKTYYLGLQADTGRSADWPLVVWKEKS